LDLHQTFLKKSFRLLTFTAIEKIVFFRRHFANERQAKKAKGELVTSRQSFGQLCPFSRSKLRVFSSCIIFQFENWTLMEVPFISPVKIPEDDTLPSFFAGGFFAELDEPG